MNLFRGAGHRNNKIKLRSLILEETLPSFNIYVICRVVHVKALRKEQRT